MFALVRDLPAQDPAYRPARPPPKPLTCAEADFKIGRAHRGTCSTERNALSSASRARPLASGTRFSPDRDDGGRRCAAAVTSKLARYVTLRPGPPGARLCVDRLGPA